MNGDLISRERLKRMIKVTKKRAEGFVNQTYWTGYAVALSTLEGIIADEPAVDAAPVVRCKKCINRGKPFSCPMCYAETSYEDDYDNYYTVDQTDDDGFCHRGEKMDEEES